MQYQELTQELEQHKVQAQIQARSLVENEIREKDIQIQRFKEEVDIGKPNEEKQEQQINQIFGIVRV